MAGQDIQLQRKGVHEPERKDGTLGPFIFSARGSMLGTDLDVQKEGNP
jgi:hypothetical protein